LKIDLEEHGHAAGQPVVDRLARRAISVAGELGPFEEFTIGDEAVELVVCYEEVLDTVRLTRAGLTRRYRDGEPDFWMGGA
jgi:hypothetical protein